MRYFTKSRIHKPKNTHTHRQNSYCPPLPLNQCFQTPPLSYYDISSWYIIKGLILSHYIINCEVLFCNNRNNTLGYINLDCGMAWLIFFYINCRSELRTSLTCSSDLAVASLLAENAPVLCKEKIRLHEERLGQRFSYYIQWSYSLLQRPFQKDVVFFFFSSSHFCFWNSEPPESHLGCFSAMTLKAAGRMETLWSFSPKSSLLSADTRTAQSQVLSHSEQKSSNKI